MRTQENVSIDVHLFGFSCDEYTRLISLNLLSHVRRMVFVTCATRRHQGTHNLCRQLSIHLCNHGYEKLVTQFQGDLSVDG